MTDAGVGRMEEKDSRRALESRTRRMRFISRSLPWNTAGSHIREKSTYSSIQHNPDHALLGDFANERSPVRPSGTHALSTEISDMFQ